MDYYNNEFDSDIGISSHNKTNNDKTIYNINTTKNNNNKNNEKINIDNSNNNNNNNNDN